jgi:hypothetical protein
MAVFDVYGWSYTCGCGHVGHIGVQTESRSLDDPGEQAIEDPSAASDEYSAEQAGANVLRLYPVFKGVPR